RRDVRGLPARHGPPTRPTVRALRFWVAIRPYRLTPLSRGGGGAGWERGVRAALTSSSRFATLPFVMQTSESHFDEPLNELRRRIEELEGYPAGSGQEREIERLRATLKKSTSEVYGNLDRWQKTLVARHADRPYTLDYVHFLMSDWVELHGDRAFGDDPAIVAGFATFQGRSVAVIGHEKGRDTKELILRNFGQPRPEGYRKALRVMRL